jgi:hypothetical protein
MFSRGFATGRTSAHNVQICTARVLTGSTLMPAQIGGTARVLPELSIAQGDAVDRRSPRRFSGRLP